MVVWKYYDEEKKEYILQGHSGALWDDNELRDGRLRLKGQMNKGQDFIHNKLREAYAKGHFFISLILEIPVCKKISTKYTNK